MLSLLIPFLHWMLWIYFWYFLILTSILASLTFAYRLSKVGTKLNYVLCYAIVMIGFWLIPGLLLPIFAARPRHWQNALIMAWHLRKLSYLARFTWEVRGVRYAKEDNGAIICCNHQSIFDILGDMNTGNVFKRRGTIAKKSLLYIFPLGLGSWLSNIIFIDRSNPKAVRETLEQLTSLMTEKKMKILFYPEGTRNGDYGFLPFKKGAFVYAIKAQVPVIPMVYSPLYFRDHKRGIFLFDKKHTIVSVLKPIPTKGMTEANLEDLMKKTYDVMFVEYEKLSKEVTRCSKDPSWVNKDRPRFIEFD